VDVHSRYKRPFYAFLIRVIVTRTYTKITINDAYLYEKKKENIEKQNRVHEFNNIAYKLE